MSFKDRALSLVSGVSAFVLNLAVMFAVWPVFAVLTALTAAKAGFQYGVILLLLPKPPRLDAQ